jgi:hypothetical protein
MVPPSISFLADRNRRQTEMFDLPDAASGRNSTNCTDKGEPESDIRTNNTMANEMKIGESSVFTSNIEDIL